jgi:hypothetical protein
MWEWLNLRQHQPSLQVVDGRYNIIGVLSRYAGVDLRGGPLRPFFCAICRTRSWRHARVDDIDKSGAVKIANGGSEGAALAIPVRHA